MAWVDAFVDGDAVGHCGELGGRCEAVDDGFVKQTSWEGKCGVDDGSDRLGRPCDSGLPISGVFLGIQTVLSI